MNNRLLSLTGIAALCAYAVLLASPAQAQFPGFKDKKASTIEQMALLEEKGREALKAREWIVYLTAKGEKSANETDVYVFGDGTMESKGLFARGYPVSNITLSIANDGAVIWETMKTTATKDKAFYRGELRGNVMTGTMVMKSSKGLVSTFSFSTLGAAPAAPVVKQPVAEAKVSATNKKTTYSLKGQ
jgi:hypothetical protein